MAKQAHRSAEELHLRPESPKSSAEVDAWCREAFAPIKHYSALALPVDIDSFETGTDKICRKDRCIATAKELDEMGEYWLH